MKAVLFDAAGTLIQLREPLGETYARLAREFGVSLPGDRIALAFGRAFEQMPPMVFPNQPVDRTQACERAWWQDLVRNTFRDADPTVELTDFEQYFDRLFAHFARPASWEAVPGARALLTALRARRVRIGIVSNFDHRLLVLLDGLQLSPFFDVVIRPADAQAAKPDPQIFTVALSHLGVPAAEAVHVGDHPEHDVAAARAAGLHAIHVTSPDSLWQAVEWVDGQR